MVEFSPLAYGSHTSRSHAGPLRGWLPGPGGRAWGAQCMDPIRWRHLHPSVWAPAARRTGNAWILCVLAKCMECAAQCMDPHTLVIFPPPTGNVWVPYVQAQHTDPIRWRCHPSGRAPTWVMCGSYVSWSMQGSRGPMYGSCTSWPMYGPHTLVMFECQGVQGPHRWPHGQCMDPTSPAPRRDPIRWRCFHPSVTALHAGNAWIPYVPVTRGASTRMASGPRWGERG